MTYHEKQTLKTKYNNYKNFLMNHSYKITKTQSSINMSNENYMPQNVGVSSITISKRNSTSKILYKRTFKLWMKRLMQAKIKHKLFCFLIVAICYLLIYLIYKAYHQELSNINWYNSPGAHKIGINKPENEFNDLNAYKFRSKRRYVNGHHYRTEL